MEGYEVQEAENGQEALDRLMECAEPPCLILLDLTMPVLDGVGFRKLQLQNPAIADVPVIVFTGRSDKTGAQDLRPLSVVAKPFDIDVILDIIRKHCRSCERCPDSESIEKISLRV
jgi:CheY-like chemotaxis protein